MDFLSNNPKKPFCVVFLGSPFSLYCIHQKNLQLVKILYFYQKFLPIKLGSLKNSLDNFWIKCRLYDDKIKWFPLTTEYKDDFWLKVVYVMAWLRRSNKNYAFWI